MMVGLTSCGGSSGAEPAATPDPRPGLADLKSYARDLRAIDRRLQRYVQRQLGGGLLPATPSESKQLALFGYAVEYKDLRDVLVLERSWIDLTAEEGSLWTRFGKILELREKYVSELAMAFDANPFYYDPDEAQRLGTQMNKATARYNETLARVTGDPAGVALAQIRHSLERLSP
jgi:hypothetical protein